MGFRKLFSIASNADLIPSVKTSETVSPIHLPAPDRPLSAKVLELESRIRELLREPHLFDRFFLPISREFYSICWGFPASDGNHHPGRLGLIEHSLGVVVRMLRDAPLVREGLIGGEREKFSLHCLLAGLGHDLGKTMEWTVDSRGYNYSPIAGSVRDQGFTPVAHHNTNRHSLLSTLVFSRLIAVCPAYMYGRLYDPRDLGLVVEAIISHHESPAEDEIKRNPYLSLLRKADREDATEDMIVVPSEAEITAREEQIVKDREEVRSKQVEIAVRAIRLVLADAKYGDGWYLTENGWLLIVSPRWTDQSGQGIFQIYTQLFGREVRPYDLWSLLKDSGKMLVLDEDEKDFRRLRIAKPGHKGGEKSLYFAVFPEDAILTPEEAEELERYTVKGLGSLLQKTLFTGGPVDQQETA